MKTSNWEKVGVVGVNTGTLWLGDPCYCVTPDGSNHPAATWPEFCDALLEKEKATPGAAQWNFKLGRPGLGVTVLTGYGDGAYPVEVRRTPDGRIAEVRVKFT